MRNDTARSLDSSASDDLVVEDVDATGDAYRRRVKLAVSEDRQTHMKVTHENSSHRDDQPKLKHWELLALEQLQQDSCTCRHHVVRLEGNRIESDWCRCKDHRHEEVMRKQQVTAATPFEPTEAAHSQRSLILKRPGGVHRHARTSQQPAFAYDRSIVDQDARQELIYCRTSSGRLVSDHGTLSRVHSSLSRSKLR
jgi:hypothetical protein